jgi:hypothetical protein
VVTNSIAFCKDRESAHLMYHVFHAFAGKRGGGAFDKVSAAHLQKVSRPLNTVSCIRVASFVSLVKFGSSDMAF